MKEIQSCHVMAKPSGSVCNISCNYCFYLEKEQLYPERKTQWKMSDETLELFIRQHIEAQPGSQVTFAWQGGEPTLLGLEFFEKAIMLANKYRGQKQIHHALQTNGILIDDKWCRFLKRHGFLVGISIDGPQELHDHYRVTRANKGTFTKVMACIERLKQHGIAFNTLTALSDINVQHPMLVYRFLKQIGSHHMQFIPLVERITNPSDEETLPLAAPDVPFAEVTPWSVSPKAYGEFLNKIFDEWVQSDIGVVSIQIFDAIFASWLGAPPAICVFAPHCGHAFALEANGDLYQCDHFVYPEYRLGNIHQQSIKSLNQSQEAIEFGQHKAESLSQECKLCSYRFACHGGCPKHRFMKGASGKPDGNYLCEGYQAVFAHTEKAMKIMVALYRRKRPPADVAHYL